MTERQFVAKEVASKSLVKAHVAAAVVVAAAAVESRSLRINWNLQLEKR